MTVTKSPNCIDFYQFLKCSFLDEINIFLTTNDGQYTSHISCSSNITVDNLKSKIREKESIGHNFRLLHHGKELCGWKLLSACNITRDSHLVMADTRGKLGNFYAANFLQVKCRSFI